MKSAQPIRWPIVRPVVLLGGFDIENGGCRYFHLGPFAFTVDRWRDGWSFWVGSRRGSVKVRVHA